MSKKRSMRTRKKVVQAAKQRRKYRIGGGAFERAEERRKLNKKTTTNTASTTNTTPTPKKGALAKETTSTAGTVMAEPTRTSKEQGFYYGPGGRTESEDNGEPEDTNTTNTTEATRTDFSEQEATADERRLRAQTTAADAEDLASGTLSEDLKLADISADGKTQLDSTIEGGDTTIDDFTDARATQATSPRATTVTEGTTTKAELPSDFSLAKLNDDITSGVSRRVGSNYRAVQNEDGTYSFAAFNRLGKQVGTYRNKKYATPEQMVADAGLNMRSYQGLPGAAKMDAVEVEDLQATQAAQLEGLTKSAAASAASLETDEMAKGARFFAENLSDEQRKAKIAELSASATNFDMQKAADFVDPETGEVKEGAILSEVAEVTGKGGEVGFTVLDEAATVDRDAITTASRDPETGELLVSGIQDRQAASVLDAVDETGKTAAATPDQIKSVVGFSAAQRNQFPTGKAKSSSPADMMAALDKDLDPDIAAVMVEDPASVEAQLDNESVEVRAAIAALPTEALVSSQMTTLLDGIEEGKTPAWARPAVAAVEQTLAQRGLSASTIGRDALFNVIIQSALPIAQANAQALQSRAAQNLSNQQQANLAQSTQDMQRRMANLANRQTAVGQTAQFAQQMSTLQSQFKQQEAMTEGEQAQQIRLQNLQNSQRAAEIKSSNAQAMAAQNLGNEQQIELANLQIKNQTQAANMTARNQERLAEMQVAADFLSKNAAFKQQMDLAKLTNDQQTRLANLTALNEAGRDNLNAEQQTELANLDATLKSKITSANLANSLGIAQLSADQQRAMTNAQMYAKIDMAKFTDAQQVELANSRFMQTMTMSEFNADQQAAMLNATNLAQMSMQEADLATRVSIENAQSFLKMDMANLSNSQQALVLDQQLKQQRMLSNQAAQNAARQFNATSENQTNQFQANLAAQMSQFNATQSNAMSQFNAQQTNMQAAKDADRTADVNKFNAQLSTTISQFNAQQDNQRIAWNAQNAAAVEASNVAWRRRANEIDTATQNAINMQNTMNAFNMSKAANAFLWQEVRDQADHDFRSYEGDQARRASIIVAALGADGEAVDEALWDSKLSDAITAGLDLL